MFISNFIRKARRKGSVYLERKMVWFCKTSWFLKAFRRLCGGNKYIAVVGGHGGRAVDDNSRELARHLLASKQYRVYWVVTSLDAYRVARDLGCCPVWKSSLKRIVSTVCAHIIIYSHGWTDISHSGYRSFPWRTTLYCGHGVWGLKRVERNGAGKKGALFDYTLAVSDAEAERKASVFNIPVSKIWKTGLPKHDALISKRGMAAIGYEIENVLIMLTWRDWLQYKPTERAVAMYLQGLEGLLSSENNGFKLHSSYNTSVVLHANIRGLKKEVKELCSLYSVNFYVSHEVDMQSMLQDSDALITDYSAVFWDFMIQDKPVVRYPFDEEFYEYLIGSYPDITPSLEGVTAARGESVWNLLKDPLLMEKAHEIKLKMMPYSDGESSQKIIKLLEKDGYK